MDFALLQAEKRSYEPVSKKLTNQGKNPITVFVTLLIFFRVFWFSSDIIRKMILKQSYSYAFLWAGNSIFVLLLG